MKKVILCIILLGCSLSIFSSSLNLQLDSIYPNQVHLSWDKVKGAEYYDLYLNLEPMVRTTETKAILGSNEDPLLTHTDYKVILNARNKDEEVVAADNIKFTTSGWEGHYLWINKTDDDNRGRCKQLEYLVSYKEGKYTIDRMFEEQLYKLFPLVSPESIGKKFSFDGERPEEISYRVNARAFNTTNYSPKSWSIDNIYSSDSYLESKSTTSISFIKIPTVSKYTFVVSKEGEREMHFQTVVSKMVSQGTFTSPNPGDEGIFKTKAYK